MFDCLEFQSSVFLSYFYLYYSEVFKAKDKKTNKKFVAMKKVLMENEKEGVSIKNCCLLFYSQVQPQFKNVL